MRGLLIKTLVQKQHITIFITFVLALSVFTTPQVRAGTTGAIEGFARDTLQRPLADVRVSAVSPSGRNSTLTGRDGFYSLIGLPLDTYAVTFSKDGYISQTTFGVSTTPDQSIRVDGRLESGIKTLALVTVRSATSLVQPTMTADTYVVTQSKLEDINGTPQDQNGFGAFAALPGVSVDSGGSATIRAGESNDIGFTYDGIDNYDPLVQFVLNSFSLNGTQSFQLSTGGYDVSAGNTNSGVINQVIKRGTHPGNGQLTARVMSPLYGHELSFDYGDASPDNRFSYYFGFAGNNDATGYGDRTTILPLQLGNTTFSTGQDEVLNLFYHFGPDNKNELQFLSNLSTGTPTLNYLVDSTIAPYPSNNGDVQAASDPFGLCNASLSPPYPVCNTAVLQSNYLTFFPGQVAYHQNVGAPDTGPFSSVIDKLEFKRQLTPSSYVKARLYKAYENFGASQPYHTGAFSDFFFLAQITGLGEAFEYANQLNSQHELGVGGGAIYYATDTFGAVSKSLEPALEPLEDLGCPQIASAIASGLLTPTGNFNSTPGVGGCYIAPFNRALNTAIPGLGLPTDAAHAPLNTYVDDFIYVTPPIHRYDLWVKDRYQPSRPLTVTVGLRWDAELVGIPADAAAQNTTYFINDRGDFVTVPGQPIGNDVRRPMQVSPRFAASYELGSRDVVRLSYGKNIEFEPLYGVERRFNVPAYLQNCTIDNGCFNKLPGYGVTNFVTNLYQQVVLDLTTHLNAQYGDVRPQRAANLDFSYAHDFGSGLELRVTPYYRKGYDYTVSNQPLLFNLRTSGIPVFGPDQQISAGINESTGVEFALQRSSQSGISGLFDATYDNTLANYDGDFFPNANNALIASGHLIHVTYVAPLVATLNLVYNARSAWHASATVSCESGYRYGVGKKTFVFINGDPTQVLNTDLAQSSSQVYYFTDPSNPGTIQHPNIVASRGTPEGDDPGTLFTPATAIVNLSISRSIRNSKNSPEAGVRIQNVFGNYTPTAIPPNLFYVPQGIGAFGPGSGINGSACAPHQTFGCEPFMYNQSKYPYESEPSGPPRNYTFFVSIKY